MLPAKLITENYEPQPRNVYGLTHYLSEKICNYFNNNSEINCTNIRLSNSYGSPVFYENNCWRLVINDLCKSAFTKRTIQLRTDGSAQRDFIHGDDVFYALECIILSRTYKNRDYTFHIASGNTMTILEIAHCIKRVYKNIYKEDINISLPSSLVTNHINSNPKERYKIDNSRIKKIGFSQKTDLETGIKEIFTYLQNIS